MRRMRQVFADLEVCKKGMFVNPVDIQGSEPREVGLVVVARPHISGQVQQLRLVGAWLLHAELVAGEPNYCKGHGGVLSFRLYCIHV